MELFLLPHYFVECDEHLCEFVVFLCQIVNSRVLNDDFFVGLGSVLPRVPHILKLAHQAMNRSLELCDLGEGLSDASLSLNLHCLCLLCVGANSLKWFFISLSLISYLILRWVSLVEARQCGGAAVLRHPTLQ